MYNGLTTADKGALLNAKARGANWIARDENFILGEFIEKPTKVDHYWMGQSQDENWGVDDDNVLKFIKWSDTEPVNIDLALAQIAEMELTTSTPMTWNDRINQMTVEEKALLFQHDDCFIYKLTKTAYCDRHLGCEECAKQFLNSPYTEGEKHEG